MKKIFKIMSCAILVTSLTGCGSNPTPSNKEDNVVTLTKSEYKIAVNDLYKTLKEKYAINYIIQEIDEEILNKEYETDEEAETYVDNQIKIVKMYYNNDDSQLLSALQNAGYNSINEYKEYIMLNYKRKLATEDYIKKNISDNEITKYYDKNIYGDVTISHILIKLESSDNLTNEEKKEQEDKANKKIKEIYEKLNDGKTFLEVAKEYSEDVATASDGGRIGTFNKDEMTKQFNEEFENTVLSLKVGEYNKKIIKTSYGYHIIYKDSEKEKPSLETVKQTIIENLVNEKSEEDTKAQYKALIELRNEYGISFNDDDIKNQYDNVINNWLYSKDSD